MAKSKPPPATPLYCLTLYTASVQRSAYTLHTLTLCIHARPQLQPPILNHCTCSALAEKGSSRRLRGDSDSTDGDTLSSVSASTLASLRDDFGDEDPADEHPLERVIDALYEKRRAAAVGHAVQKRAYVALGCFGRCAVTGAVSGGSVRASCALGGKECKCCRVGCTLCVFCVH